VIGPSYDLSSTSHRYRISLLIADARPGPRDRRCIGRYLRGAMSTTADAALRSGRGQQANIVCVLATRHGARRAPGARLADGTEKTAGRARAHAPASRRFQTKAGGAAVVAGRQEAARRTRVRPLSLLSPASSSTAPGSGRQARVATTVYNPNGMQGRHKSSSAVSQLFHLPAPDMDAQAPVRIRIQGTPRIEHNAHAPAPSLPASFVLRRADPLSCTYTNPTRLRRRPPRLGSFTWSHPAARLLHGSSPARRPPPALPP
jgi:hypothetical protein